MSDKTKFQTIHDTWIYGVDVEDPDILKDPTGYYDWLFAMKEEQNLSEVDDGDDYGDDETEDLGFEDLMGL